MALTDKQIEQRIEALADSGYNSGLADMGGSFLTWGDEAKIINMSMQTLVRFIDRIEADFPALAYELKRIDDEYDIEKEAK
jgi:hypothetical protein